MRHVLIVDDALDLGRLLKTALSLIDSTMPIVVVPSGEEALLEAARYPLDLLVSDIRLPGISGVELISKIRKLHPDVKIIVITGMSDEQVARDVRSLGVDHFFSKPLSMPEFTSAARRCLQMDLSESAMKLAAVESTPRGKESTRQMGDVLSGIWGRLGASAVVLLDERARVTAQAGTIPELFQAEDVLTRFKTAASSSIGVSGILGKKFPETVTAYLGETHDLILAPIGGHTLIVLLESKPTKIRLALSFEEAIQAQSELMKILQELGLVENIQERQEIFAAQDTSFQTAQEPEEPIDVESIEEFEALFQQGGSIDEMNAERYWESAAEKVDQVEVNDPDVLSYEQARQLGLTPDPEE